ncbi:hypothetical protein PI87_08860 [Ralstonia sp. A12]|uniref:phage tail protein n=1 Tax=Ralstonia sp. A12 TaxID=1217052 RepID=UPI0005747E48|nr:phage tail protein [Ralstonia sp. A12]KHK57320.1 hypothetical protein PI87_08860 [Ralstonia sp. A12]
MPDQSKEIPQPPAVLVFLVDIGGMKDMPFLEVSGLDVQTESIEYRANNAKSFPKIKVPGVSQDGHVTLKRGIFVKDSTFWAWYAQIQANTIQRQTVTIKLLDAQHKQAMTWTLQSAWPTKVTGVNAQADHDDVMVELIELAHEGITVTGG